MRDQQHRRAAPSRTGGLRRLAERSTLVAGLACLGVWALARAEGALAGAEALEQARRSFGPQAASAPPQPPDLGALERRLSLPNTGDWDSRRVELWRLARQEAREAPVAILEYPRLGLEVAVLEGVGEAELNRGAGRIPGTAPPGRGNCGIAGHRDGYFRVLEKASVGDRLLLTSNRGTGEYEVVSLDVVPPEDVSVLEDSGRPELTLVTCHPFRFLGSAPNRFVLRAQRVAWRDGVRDGASRQKPTDP